LIRNCPVTADDAKQAIVIYGPDVTSLKGKMVKGPAQTVPTFTPILVPDLIIKDHKDITLCMDFFCVQGNPFFHTICRKIEFCTVSPVKATKTNKRPKANKVTILKETLFVIKLYHARGFNVIAIHADMDFECIRDNIPSMHFELTAKDAHVGEIERSICTIKEHIRADVHDMPYKRLPKMLTIELVRRAVMILNQFPALDGVSETLSPLSIMTGCQKPDYQNLKAGFGEYALVFEDNDPTNTTKARRSMGAITLNQTGNATGDYHFM
jgi:hypothetical protein